MNYYMPENIIINYWVLNKVYVIVALFIIIGFCVIHYLLFVNLRIKVSKELNVDCKNPLAIYFDKGERDRCLTEKIAKTNEFNHVTKNLENKKQNSEQNVKTMNAKMAEIDNYYKNLQTEKNPKIVTMQKLSSLVTKIYENIYFIFENSQTNMEKIKTDFETSLENIIQNVVNIGNDLVNNLKLKVKIPKWDKRKPLVDGYEKIKKYLNNKKIKPYLDRLKDDNPENVAKIQNIQNLPNEAKTGPKKK